MTHVTSSRRRLPIWAQDLIAGIVTLAAGFAAIAVANMTNWYPQYPNSYDWTVVLTAAAVTTRRILPRTTWIVAVVGFPLLWHWPISMELQVLPIAVACFGATRSGRVPVWLTAVGGAFSSAVVYVWNGQVAGALNAAVFHGNFRWLRYFDFFEIPVWVNYSKFALIEFIVLSFAFVGWAMRRMDRQRQQLEVQNRQLAELRDVEAREAVAAERTRIARELHDVVAHHISAIVVRAQAAKRIGDPVSALGAMDWIAGTGREALTAMRTTVRVLRDDEGSEYAPTGDLGEIDAAIARMREAGLGIQARIDTDLPPLQPAAAAALIRVAQESLTNVLLHSWARTATLSISAAASGVELVVSDQGPPRPVEDHDRRGHGLSNMGERIRLAGGQFSAGPEQSGWRVSAWVPATPG